MSSRESKSAGARPREADGQTFLILSTVLPYPPNNGKSMRSWSLFRSLSDAGHRLSLLTLGDPVELEKHREEVHRVFRCVEVIPHRPVHLDGHADYIRRLRALGSSIPYSVLRFRSDHLKARLSALLSRENYDAVISESPYPLVNLAPESQLPLILSEQNIEHVLLERYIRTEHNPLKKLYARLEARRLVRWQLAAWSKAALVLVCSEHDRSVLRALSPRTDVAVVPNCIDLSRYPLSNHPDGGYLLYAGALDWYPNQDAVQYLLSEIFPQVQRELPEARVVVAGRNPPLSFRKRYTAREDVTFLESVSDMCPVIAEAAVCLVPVRIGSGTRIKILEAAALGRAIVSTPIGAEGLDLEDGREILIAATPAEFANSTVKLLRDSHLRRRLGMAARRKVERDYGLDTFAKAVHEALPRSPAKRARDTSKLATSLPGPDVDVRAFASDQVVVHRGNE